MGIPTTQNHLQILIRCDGSPQLGLGHIVRCLALACELRDTYGVQPGFAIIGTGVAEALVEQENFPVFTKPDNIEEAQWIYTLVEKHSFNGLILDIRTTLPASALSRWRNDGLTVAVIDDPSDRRQAADLAFYPPVPQMTKADWSRFTGQAFIGWDYLLLRREFSIRREPPQNPIPSILVTMGGSDPGGLTLLALKALCQVKEPFYARVVLGRAFLHDQALEQLRPSLPDKFEFLRDVSDMPSLMAGTDLAVAAFGGTAYELAALNVPAVLLGLTQDHAHSAGALADAGMAVSLGDYRQLSENHVAEAVTQLLSAPGLRKKMQEACELVDGKGVQRITLQIIDSLRSQKQKG
jgi:spore coat polysaccharide biosynthesis protein SpsF